MIRACQFPCSCLARIRLHVPNMDRILPLEFFTLTFNHSIRIKLSLERLGRAERAHLNCFAHSIRESKGALARNASGRFHCFQHMRGNSRPAMWAIHRGSLIAIEEVLAGASWHFGSRYGAAAAVVPSNRRSASSVATLAGDRVEETESPRKFSARLRRQSCYPTHGMSALYFSKGCLEDARATLRADMTARCCTVRQCTLNCASPNLSVTGRRHC
jgi:hypothetical protein